MKGIEVNKIVTILSSQNECLQASKDNSSSHEPFIEIAVKKSYIWKMKKNSNFRWVLWGIN